MPPGRNMARLSKNAVAARIFYMSPVSIFALKTSFILMRSRSLPLFFCFFAGSFTVAAEDLSTVSDDAKRALLMAFNRLQLYRTGLPEGGMVPEYYIKWGYQRRFVPETDEIKTGELVTFRSRKGYGVQYLPPMRPGGEVERYVTSKLPAFGWNRQGIMMPSVNRAPPGFAREKFSELRETLPQLRGNGVAAYIIVFGDDKKVIFILGEKEEPAKTYTAAYSGVDEFRKLQLTDFRLEKEEPAREPRPLGTLPKWLRQN